MSESAEFVATSIILMSILALLTVSINATSLYVISKSRRMLECASTYLIINVLVVDLLQGAIVFPLYALKKHALNNAFWYGTVWDSFRFAYILTYYASVLGVLLIAIDRYVATRYVYAYKAYVSLNKVLAVLACFWIYIFIVCIIPFATRGTPRQKIVHLLRVNRTLKIYQTYIPTREWTVTMLSTQCLLPYIVIVVLYALVLRSIRHIEHDSGRCPVVARRYERRYEHSNQYHRITRLSMLITVAYALLWIPSIVYYTLNIAGVFPHMNARTEQLVSFSVKYTAFVNSLAAPLIYCFSNASFRRRLLHMVKRRQGSYSSNRPSTTAL